MTKAELIRKISKYVGVPDPDAKIFFELFLKKISAVVDIGQSIFVKDFGYFHLIKGRIKKPVFSFKDNEVSEEEVDLVLFSEDKDLRKSDTKGLVFNIQIFDEEDYHPIDSSFSLSIGKPLIPLRGVPFENIYIPTSGYEYRRLIESKVEKIIGASEIAESEEKFPTLVIDARSYNSNQVQLLWDDKSQTETTGQPQTGTDSEGETKTELSEYEKQTNELKNIAWDFGEDLSQQIEEESILDITDERINIDLIKKVNFNIEQEVKTQELDDIKDQPIAETSIIEKKNNSENNESVQETFIDNSSEKLNELLEDESKPDQSAEEELETLNVNDLNNEFLMDNQIEEAKPKIIEDNDIEKVKPEIIENDKIEEVKSDIIENVEIEDEKSDKEIWENSSKYFQPYKPESKNTSEEEFGEVNSATFNFGNMDAEENKVLNLTESEEESMSEENPIEDEVNDNNIDDKNKLAENEVKNISGNDIELEKVDEQKPEFYKPEKKRNLIPFIVFPLIVIIISLVLYWYLEFYKKSENKVLPKQIVLKSDNAKFVSRNFDLPVTYPYMPKVNETTISETVTPPNEEPIVKTEKIVDKNIGQNKPEEKKTEKEIPKQKITDSKEPVKTETLTGKGLNVGNNIFKYSNYFVVQVASFRASSISENEAGKYRNKGYNAFVEAAEIPNRGTWYRVRVGNFSSKEEAQIFVDKNIR